MVANKQFQVAVIRRQLEQKGIPSDLVDVEAYVDSTLTLEENARIIKEEVQGMMRENYGVPETKSTKKMERFLDAIDRFGKRRAKQQMTDINKQAKDTFSQGQLRKSNYKKWVNNPNRYDIEGVDSKY